MDGWNTSFLLGRPIFRGENVSFRKCNFKRKQHLPIESTPTKQPTTSHLFLCDQVANATAPAGYDGEAVSSRYITTLYWAMSLGARNQIDKVGDDFGHRSLFQIRGQTLPYCVASQRTPPEIRV